jgi:hypothetical protein
MGRYTERYTQRALGPRRVAARCPPPALLRIACPAILRQMEAGRLELCNDFTCRALTAATQPQEGHLEIDTDRRPDRRRSCSRLPILGQPEQYHFQGARYRDQEGLVSGS